MYPNLKQWTGQALHMISHLYFSLSCLQVVKRKGYLQADWGYCQCVHLVIVGLELNILKLTNQIPSVLSI
jgi:hypothetical protein